MEEGTDVVEPNAQDDPEKSNDDTNDGNDSKASKGEEDGANEDEPPKKKICGAARKRYRILLAHGIGEEEAKERAISKRMLTADEKRQHQKKRYQSMNVKYQHNYPNPHARRLYMDAHLEMGLEDHPQRMPNPQFDNCMPPLCPPPLKGAKFINLCHEYFPNVLLSRKHMIAIKRSLSRIYCNAPNTIRVYEVNIDLGWLRVSYDNETSRNWLNDAVEPMEPLNGVKLKMVEDKEFPTLRVVYFEANTKYKSNAEVLKNLKIYNKDLNLNSWRVLERYEKRNQSVFVFTMNASSFEALKNAKFVVRYKTGTYTLRTFNEVRDCPEEAWRAEREHRQQQQQQEYDEAFFIGDDAAARRFARRPPATAHAHAPAPAHLFHTPRDLYQIYDDDRY